MDVDSSNSTYCTAVSYVKDHGVTVGCTDGTHYCPNDYVTRLQMALFMQRFGLGDPSNPFHIGMQDGEPFAFAGLWSYWKPPEGKPLVTYTIITTAPNELCAPIHNRIPVILDHADYSAWLNDTPDRAKALLQPYPADEMRAYPVSTKVNSPKHEAANLVGRRSMPGNARA